jgi:hypothetical protein
MCLEILGAHRSVWLKVKAIVHSTSFIDMNDYICPWDVKSKLNVSFESRNCPAVIGNILVWRDGHHITKTYLYLLTLVDVFESELKRLDEKSKLRWAI